MKSTSIMSSDWRFTIPKSVRDELNLQPGDYVELARAEAGKIVISKANAAYSSAAKKRGTKLRIEESN